MGPVERIPLYGVFLCLGISTSEGVFQGIPGTIGGRYACP